MMLNESNDLAAQSVSLSPACFFLQVLEHFDLVVMSTIDDAFEY